MRRDGLLAWYRVFPLLAVLVFGLVSVVYSFAPSFIFRPFYSLSYESDIVESSKAYGVDPYLVAAVIRTESNWDEDAESHSGARGLMQLMPETARDMVQQGYVDGREFDPSDLSDPSVNIRYGCAYLSYLLDYFNGATDKAIAAYNAGMGNVDDWAKDKSRLHNAITFPETQAYLVRVTMTVHRYRDLYPTSFE